MPDRALGWHVTMRLADDRVVARNPPERRVIAQTMFKLGERIDLLAFRVADSHLHALLMCARAEAGRFARSAASSIRQRLHIPVSFRTHFLAVRDQRHLTYTFGYVLRQEERHGISLDPTQDGSSLPDLLGLRVLAPWSIQRVRTLLPRIRSAELHDILGVDLRRAPTGLDHLRESAAAAAGALGFSERTEIANRARIAAVHVGRALGLPQPRVVELLQLDRRTVRRLEARAPDEAMSRAVLLQMRLRAALRGEARPAWPALAMG